MNCSLTESEVVRAVDTVSDLKQQTLMVLNDYIEIMIYNDQVLNYRSHWKNLNHPYEKKESWANGISINGFDELHRIKVTGYFKGNVTVIWEQPVYYDDDDDDDNGRIFMGTTPKEWETCYRTDEKLIELQLNIPLWMINDPEKAKQHFVSIVNKEKEKRKLEELERQRKSCESSLEEINKQLNEILNPSHS